MRVWSAAEGAFGNVSFHRSSSLGGVHRYIQPTRSNHLPEIEKIGSRIKRKSAGILCIPTPWGLCLSGLYAPHEEQRKQQQQLFLGEFPAQLLERRIHMVFHRARRNAQLLSDLAVRKVFDVAQTEHFAAFGRAATRWPHRGWRAGRRCRVSARRGCCRVHSTNCPARRCAPGSRRRIRRRACSCPGS